MGVLDFFRKRDEGGLQFRRDLILTESGGEASKPSNPEAEYVAMVGKMGFMVMDEHLITFLYQNTILHPLIPVFSPVNATIKLDKRQADLKRIRLENLLTQMKLTMPSDVYDANGLEILDGLRMFGHDRVSEAVDGWKGHLVTEQVKVIETRTPEKKGIFSR